MSQAAQLAINRANTLRYINLDPTSIILTPRTETWVAGTKKLVAGTPRDAQNFKVIWQNLTGIVQTMNGITRRFDFILIGAHDAEIAINDFWSINQQDYEITYVEPSNGYEIRAGGTSYGNKPNG